MVCFVNLPLYWAQQNPAWIDWYVAGRINPELGFDQRSLELPDSWHELTAARFHDAGLVCSVHLPFWDVEPCDPDEATARFAREAIKRGAELARIYNARHMIGHPRFRPRMPGRETDDIRGLWMEKALAAWWDIPALGGAPLFLENTDEATPEAIAALVGILNRSTTDFGVCFDLGHWRAFAGGRTEEDLTAWLDAFAPFAMHLHLHDNDGEADLHNALGSGGVPFEALFASLAARGKNITATLEPHDVTALSASADWLDAHRDIAERIGWERPLLERLPLDEIQKSLAM